MIRGNIGRVDVAAQVLVPARYAFGMGFDAESVQFALAHGGEGGRALSGGAEFGLIRQQVVAEVVTGCQEFLYIAGQERSRISGMLRCFKFCFRFCRFQLFGNSQ